MIRLLVVDDHEIVRASIATMLGRTKGLEVAGQAADGLEALEKVRELHPDVVLMDMQMPRLNGVEATRRIKAEFPQVQVLVLTTYDDDELIWGGIQAGAKGYLLKDAPLDDLFKAIHAVAQGQSLLQPSVAAKLVNRISGGAGTGPTAAPGDNPLTERELAIVALMARGMGNKEIAAELNISDNTVKTHISNLFQKMGTHDRAETVAKAIQKGYIKP